MINNKNKKHTLFSFKSFIFAKDFQILNKQWVYFQITYFFFTQFFSFLNLLSFFIVFAGLRKITLHLSFCL